MTQDQIMRLVDEYATLTADIPATTKARAAVVAAIDALQPNTQEPRKDIAFGGPKAREQMLNQLAHPAPKDSDEPRLSDLFCGVDVTEGMLSVSVLRRRSDDVAEVLHSEQFELPQAKPLTDEQKRCPLCRYDHGHSIGCDNNPVDIALKAADTLEAQAKRIAELERPPAPDCRTCADRLRCVNTWHDEMTCISGDQYKPGEPVVLWRTE